MNSGNFKHTCSASQDGVDFVPQDMLEEADQDVCLCKVCFKFLGRTMPMVSITELARSKEKDLTLRDDLLEGVKQHAEGEASHHELEAAQQEHISRVVVRKYKLLSRNEVLNKFKRTPRSLNLPEIRLHESPRGEARVYYAVQLDKDKQPTLREERVSSVGTKRQLIKDGVNLFQAQQGLIMQHVVGARVSKDD